MWYVQGLFYILSTNTERKRSLELMLNVYCVSGKLVLEGKKSSLFTKKCSPSSSASLINIYHHIVAYCIKCPTLTFLKKSLLKWKTVFPQWNSNVVYEQLIYIWELYKLGNLSYLYLTYLGRSVRPIFLFNNLKKDFFT